MRTLEARTEDVVARLRLVVRGAVQGVGFRPFVYRLANELGLPGWVNNSAQGVFIEVEGARAQLEQFRLRLEAERPPRSFIQSCEATWLDVVGYAGFEIRASETSGDKTALMLPDIATCPDCLREIFDPTNRRYLYPFTNCTNCGPRFSIIEALPYDRAHTSMKSFRMCPACQAEYDDPNDRRFHAQPNACPSCGPQPELWPGNAGNVPRTDDEPPRRLARGHDALLAAVHVIRCGHIVAVKGIGGFHLLVDARNETAVRRLRERKHREEKPFALMFPSLASIKDVCEVSPLEERLLRSPEAPIVLLKRLARPHPNPSHERASADHSSPGLRPPSPLLPKERRGKGEEWLGSGVQSANFGRANSHPQERENYPPAHDRFGAADGAEVGEQLDVVKRCSLSPGERVRVRAGVEQSLSQIAASVAPSNPNLGVLLPSNPIHHLLLAELGFPVVATSGNLSDEPICTDEFEALERLQGIADVMLVHNRPIVRHVDDSIVRVMLDREMVLRRARGYAPLPILVGTCSTASQTSSAKGDAVERVPTVLAVGAHLKNSVALAVGEQVFVSQHIGDLETESANIAFRRAATDLPMLYNATPEIIVADLHPDFLSTQFALERRAPARPDAVTGPDRAGSETGAPQVIHVQHHLAHVLACLAENEVELPALGVAWDGTGYGTDGTIWGGEFFLTTEEAVERIAHLRSFHLPGGDAAVKEPRRAALGLLYEVLGEETFRRTELRTIAALSYSEQATLKAMLERKVNSPMCSSMGRLFDAVASLAGLRQLMRFEGQAAMELEFALAGVTTDEAYALPLIARRSPWFLDWSSLIEGILFDVRSGVAPGEISAKFHNALAEAIIRVATQVGCPRVALSGGCFQNRYLTERAVTRLREEGFQPYWHQRVPPNDGGIALGQVVAARREIARRSAAVCDSASRSTLDSATPLDFPERCGWSEGPSRAPLPSVTHHASR